MMPSPKQTNFEKTVHRLSWTEQGEPVSTLFGDTFYSRENGQEETAHVFINGNRLPERWPLVKEFVIGELGFGTGLNFLETWRQWQMVRSTEQRLRFVSVEAFPMALSDMKRALEAWPQLHEHVQQLLAQPQLFGGQPIMLDPQTELSIIALPVEQALKQMSGPVDAWYLDGFAPAKNPDMWSAPVLQQIAKLTVEGGTFATYTCAGWVRRTLIESGFAVAKESGFGRKREMMVGIRNPSIPRSVSEIEKRQ